MSERYNKLEIVFNESVDDTDEAMMKLRSVCKEHNMIIILASRFHKEGETNQSVSFMFANTVDRDAAHALMKAFKNAVNIDTFKFA